MTHDFDARETAEQSAETASSTDASLECPVCGTRLRHDLGRNALIRDDAPTPMPMPMPGAAEDEGIYCPVCYYNLTGQTSGRCPECGSLFDREQLRKAQVTGEVALMPWDDPEVPSGWPSFWKTILITCGQPQRFSMAVSVISQRTSVRGYYRLCLLAMAASLAMPVGVLAWLDVSGDDLMAVAIGFIVPFAATLVGDFVMSALYTLLFIHPDGRRRLGPWRTIVMYNGGHWLLYAPLMAGLSMVIAIMSITGSSTIEIEVAAFILLVSAVLAIFVLWGLTLDAVVKCRAPGSWIRTPVAAAVLLLGILNYVVVGVIVARLIWVVFG